MSEKLKLFTKILIAEMEDLESDIASWGKFLEAKHKAEKVTEYVFLQNSVLLGQELSGVRKMLQAIAHEAPPAELQGDCDVACIRDYFIRLVKMESEQYEFQRAIELFLLKKIDKVFAYFRECDKE